MKCILCDKEVDTLYPEDRHSKEPWVRMWDDAIVDKIQAGYGSRFDGNIYVIAICDPCIASKGLTPFEP